MGRVRDNIRERIGSDRGYILMLALIISAAIHMRIGLKEIIEDYVHGGSKVICILLATFFAGFVAIACTLAILKISLGS